MQSDKAIWDCSHNITVQQPIPAADETEVGIRFDDRHPARQPVTGAPVIPKRNSYVSQYGIGQPVGHEENRCRLKSAG